MKEEISEFEKLYSLDVNSKTEKKVSGKTTLTYLSWAWAWAEFVKVHPTATYEVIKNEQGLPYFHDSSGAMVYTKVKAGSLTHEMWLPVMDGANKAMKSEAYSYYVKGYNGAAPTEKNVEAYSMFDINKTVMRCLVKNLAMFGLGLYIYAGEDLPEVTPDIPEYISPMQLKEIQNLISETQSDTEKLCEWLKVDSLKTIFAGHYDTVINQLNKKLEKVHIEAEDAKSA